MIKFSGKVDVKGFKECLASRPSNVFTTILACTDENDSMEYLNNWDKNIQRLGNLIEIKIIKFDSSWTSCCKIPTEISRYFKP